ncbi:MAG TPA: hypothetical protein VFH78_10785, partial [Candidatus Thermoplasmatota archaeon]|nr:hypothetical protein [Candidatus Thermoplasmatota archaeon]
TRTLPSPGALAALSGGIDSGIADLDRANVLRPGALTLVDAAGAATDVLYAWMADAAVLGRRVLVADGGNFLDVYRLAAAARRRAAARLPDAPRRELAAFEELTLDRVRLARGFTAYQVQSIVEDILPREARAEAEAGAEADAEAGAGAEADAEVGEDVGLIVAPGLLEMYLDDELSRDEALTLAKRALSTLRRLAARLHAPAVVSNSTLSPRSDHPMRVLLEESVDEHVLLAGAPRTGLAIHLPRRGAAFLAPAPGRTRLEDFLDPDERATPIAPHAPRAPGAWRSNGNRMYGKFGEARRRDPWVALEARTAAEEAA